MVAAGVDVECRDAKGNTALVYAAFRGQVEVVDVLLEAGSDAQGCNALLAASGSPSALLGSSRGHLPVVQRLLAARADVERRDEVGNFALACAAFNGHAELVDALLKAGADVHAQTRAGCSALVAAGACRHRLPDTPITVVDILVSNGADVNARDGLGQTALMRAAEAGSIRLVEALLAYGPDLEARLCCGSTALLLAAREGHECTVGLLLRARADVQAMSGVDSRSALHWVSACQDEPGIIHALLAVGAALDGTTRHGSTALMLAASASGPSIFTVETLLTAKASTEARDAAGNTALTLAQRNSRPEVLRTIEAHHAEARQARRLVLTLYVSPQEEDGYSDVVCTNIGGEEVASARADPSKPVQDIREVAMQETTAALVSFVFPNGYVLTGEDYARTLAEVVTRGLRAPGSMFSPLSPGGPQSPI